MSTPILSASEYLALPRAAETFLISPLLPTGGAMLLYGDPKVGKSYAAVQLALSVASGASDWLGFPILSSGKVVYVQLDTPRSLWAARLEALRVEGLPIESLHLADRETLGTWPFDILNTEHFVILSEAIAALNPAVVVIDTVREAHSGEENDSTAMQRVTAQLVAATQPAALILVSHSRKPSYDGAPDLIADNRGSSYVVGRMDAICRFTKKGLHYTGRAIEEGSLKLEREDSGLWVPSDLDYTPVIREILSDPNLKGLRAKARVLADKIGKSEEASRSLLRRHVSHRTSVNAEKWA